MKILFLIDTLKGYGAEKSIVEIAIRLKNYTPIFIHLFIGDDLKKNLEENKIKVYSLNLSKKKYFKRAMKLISPIILKEKPEVIHSTLFRADMISRKLKVMFPHLLLVGSFVSNSYGKNRYNQLSLLSRVKLYSTQIRDRISAPTVDYFISNSFAIKNSNIKALDIPEEKVKVIYRGRDIENYGMELFEKLSFKEKLNIKDEVIFLNVGRLNRGKGQRDLILSFKNLEQYKSDILLLIAGEGSKQTELEEMVKELELESKVLILGYRNDISQLLSIANYFVFPSYYEGLPGALIEAIFSKTPCIVSNIPENKECFPKNGAIFFEPGNMNEICSKLIEAMENYDWEDKILRSYRNAQEKFEIENVSLQYEEFYNAILKNTIKN